LITAFGGLVSNPETRELVKQLNPEATQFKMPSTPVVIAHRKVIDLMRANGYPDLGEFDDLKNEHEIKLGELFSETTDVVIVDQYPTALRPFYTKKNAVDPRYSNSYDIIFRGQEVLSGAQRITDHAELLASARAAGVNEVAIGFYLDSFKYGSYSTVGGGFGLERLLARFLGLSNIQSASLFPRTPNRLLP
jgi:aspartyl-tRNA synthetase